MQKIIDYDKLLNDYLRQLPVYCDLDRYSEIQVISQLDEFIKHKQKYKLQKDILSDTYIFLIYNNKIKTIQYSNKYIYDDLMIIENFIKTANIDLFKKNLNKVYWVDEKTKNKYVNKANKKGKETIYNNDTIGSEILNYIYDKSITNYIGERYGLDNCMLNVKLEDPELLKSKLILILNFDFELIECFYSIPYEMIQKGSANLDIEGIFGVDFDEFNTEKFFNKIEDWR